MVGFICIYPESPRDVRRVSVHSGGQSSAVVPFLLMLPSPICYCLFFTASFPVLFILLLGSEESQGAIHGSMSQPEASCSSSDSEWEQTE